MCADTPCSQPADAPRLLGKNRAAWLLGTLPTHLYASGAATLEFGSMKRGALLTCPLLPVPGSTQPWQREANHWGLWAGGQPVGCVLKEQSSAGVRALSLRSTCAAAARARPCLVPIRQPRRSPTAAAAMLPGQACTIVDLIGATDSPPHKPGDFVVPRADFWRCAQAGSCSSLPGVCGRFWKGGRVHCPPRWRSA